MTSFANRLLRTVLLSVYQVDVWQIFLAIVQTIISFFTVSELPSWETLTPARAHYLEYLRTANLTTVEDLQDRNCSGIKRVFAKFVRLNIEKL